MPLWACCPDSISIEIICRGSVFTERGQDNPKRSAWNEPLTVYM